MSFQSARILAYRNISVAGVATEIEIEGEILDDQIKDAANNPIPWRGVLRIDGPEFLALPASDPAHEDTPADPRYQAILGIALARIPQIHATWSEGVLGKPTITEKPKAQLDAIPTITPEMLAAVGS